MNSSTMRTHSSRKWQKSRTRRTDIQVAWVQQRIGHFEKVTELCTLCEKPYSFVYHDVHMIAYRFLNSNFIPINEIRRLQRSHAEDKLKLDKGRRKENKNM
ncbi:hypothetical protein MIMGU_mgv1a019459mg [Erythranthe guttata]|uniref:MADS-box domain-containing protein n=1 Tax=Erythranthe guttata TaxID=4155 RepID=A0A022QS69_ERYGU|nr:hypothetical protein MIMGU_mgv1a019459mg [Erythranthe guttata]